MEQFLPVLRRAVRSFNRHCWVAAMGSFFLALGAWVLVFGLYGGFALLIHTARLGVDASWPRWLLPGFALIVIVLFFCATVSVLLRRWHPLPERKILGWHIIGDVVLLPPRLTFAVFDNIDARIKLTAYEETEAALLAERIARDGRTYASHLGQYFPDETLRRKALAALQILGYVDKIREDEDWFYYIVSTREAELLALMGINKKGEL